VRIEKEKKYFAICTSKRLVCVIFCLILKHYYLEGVGLSVKDSGFVVVQLAVSNHPWRAAVWAGSSVGR